MLDLTADAAAALAGRLRAENIAWLTTVTPDGQPSRPLPGWPVISRRSTTPGG